MCWLFYNVWSDRRYKQFMALQSYLETSNIKKRTASLDFTVQKKFSSWTWSSKQAWNVILFKGELETFHRGNPREKWPLSSQKSRAANCWHLCCWWCSEIPDIWGRVKQGKLINQTSWLWISARFLHIKSGEQKASVWWMVLKGTRLALMLLQPQCSSVLELVNASRFSLLCHVKEMFPHWPDLAFLQCGICSVSTQNFRVQIKLSVSRSRSKCYSSISFCSWLSYQYSNSYRKIQYITLIFHFLLQRFYLSAFVFMVGQFLVWILSSIKTA